MRGIRFRSFGPVGSVLEVFIGLMVLRSVLWTDEDYTTPFGIALATAGLLVAVSGVIGLVRAVRRDTR